jgi:hypothetical protein
LYFFIALSSFTTNPSVLLKVAMLSHLSELHLPKAKANTFVSLACAFSMVASSTFAVEAVLLPTGQLARC